MAGAAILWKDARSMKEQQGEDTMTLFNRTLRAAETIRGETDTALSRRAAKRSPLAPKDDAPGAPETDLAHALRTRRMLRTPLSETR